jgi:hypothetical protein
MRDLFIFFRKNINLTEIKGVLSQGVQNVDYMINKFSKLRNSFGAFRSSDFNSDKSDLERIY